MYEQAREDIFFIMLYAVVTAMAILASCYLLFRRGNAFAPDIMPPVRLRRWTAMLFVSIALVHVWYMPLFFLTSADDILLTELICGMLDSMTVFPLSIAVMFAMLQDRRRPLWPIAVMTAPIVVGMAASIVRRSAALYPVMYVYIQLLGIGLIIYMVRETRRYGRWLRDNYADLEHKEVVQSFTVLAIMLLVFVFYEICNEGMAYLYAMLAISIVLICYLLWRVETLSDLSIHVNDAEEEPQLPLSIRNNIGPLLKTYCEEPQLYLQHDLTLSQLAKAIGTNRLYLSQYFSNQGMTYNTYVNSLRIHHFVNLYRETTATHQSVTAQQLAFQSGFRSYNTFSVAFKKMMGMTMTEWMRNVAE